MNCYYIFSNKNNVLIIDMNDIQFDILVVSHKTNAAKNKKAMPLSINAILFQQRSAFLLHITYTVFSFFIGFVIWAIFLKIRFTRVHTCTHIHIHTLDHTIFVIVRDWRTCVIGRNSFRAIYMSHGNCVSGAHLRHEALCLDGKVCHRFSPRWVELSYEIDRIQEWRERVTPRQPPEYWAQMHAAVKIIYDLDNIHKVLKSEQRKSAMPQ